MMPCVQYIGNGDVEDHIASKLPLSGTDIGNKIKFGLSSSSDKEETDSLKETQQQKSHTKRKSEEDVSSLESKASTPSNGHPTNKEAGKKAPSVVQGSIGTPWQQLLSLPPQQMLVIERMHSGARRFVVLDFGAPVLLTGMCKAAQHFAFF